MSRMCKLFMAFLMVFMLLPQPGFTGIGADGTLYLKDINADRQVGLHDIIYQLQLLSGMRQLKYLSEADDNGQIVVVAESGTIHGFVTEDTGDAEVWRIIPDALVECVSETGERFTQKSAEDGSFRFESLQAGQHVLAVSQEGYHPTRIMVEVENETVVRVNVRLKKMENANGTVQGRVLRPGQNGQIKPLPGATVSILIIPKNAIDDLSENNTENEAAPFRKTQTDDSGSYVLEDIPEGRYFVMASMTGYQKVLSIVSVIGGGKSLRNMVLFPEISEETGALIGKIVEKAPHISAGAWETYYPVQKARVSLVLIENGTVSQIISSVLSNKNGAFSFVDIPVGEYTLTVQHEKFEDYQQKIVIKPRYAQLLPVINPNSALIETDSESASGSDSQWTTTNPATSAYAFLNLIQNVGSGCFCIDQYMNWHQDTQFVRIVLTRNELPQKAMIYGHVETIDGDENEAVNRPVPGAKVVAVPYFPYPTFMNSDSEAETNFAALPTFVTETNENGYYEFVDLPVGYLVDARVTYIVAIHAPNFASSKDMVYVTPGQMVEHSVILKPEGVIATLGGQVYDGSVKCDEDNDDNSEKCFVPIENANVSLFPITETGDILPAIKGIHVRTGPEGKYFFERLAAIEYQMIVNAENFHPFKQTITLQPGDNAPINVALEPVEQTIRVKGVVLTHTECSDGICEKPVPGALVMAYPELDINVPGGHYAKTYTDENGVFRFYNVPENDYHVVIIARGFNRFEDVVHVPAEDLLEVTFSIEPVTEQGRLKGHVFNGAANCVGTNCIMNIPGAEIALFPIFSTDPNMNIEPMFHTITNERGYYYIEEIPAGKYQVTARADMFKPWEGFVEVPPGAEVVQDITLLPESEISALKGHVFEGNAETGQMSPVPNASVLLISMKNSIWIAPLRTETDEEGQFAFNDIPSGEYELTVRAEKFQPFESHIYIPAGEAIEKDIFLEHFVGEAVLKGMVRDGSVRCDTTDSNPDRCIIPIAGAHIQLYFLTPDSSMQIPNLETTSDVNGLYKFVGIPPGKYVMKVKAEGYQERNDEIGIDALETEMDILLFPMTPIAYLKGQILDGLVDCDDTTDCILPVPKARIELIPELGIDNVHPYYSESDDHGFYEFMDIPSGRYVIHIVADKYQERKDHIDIREGGNERNFELIPAIFCENSLGCSKSDYCAKPTGECEGDGICRPRPEACPEHENPVCGCDGNTYGNECKAAAAGINVLYFGMCRPEPEYGLLKGTIFNAGDSTVSSNEPLQPIAGADIYLMELLPSDEIYPPQEFKIQSNDDGTYMFEKLPVGKYVIIVRAYGYQAWKGEIAIIQDETTIKDVYLVSFSAEASLKGIVNGFFQECDNTTATNACLKPIADALILLTPLNLTFEIDSDATIDNMIEPLTTRTDDSGHYVFDSLKSGEYLMFVEAADWEIWEHPVKVLPGKENNIDIELEPRAKPAKLMGMVRNGAVDCDSNVSDCIVGIPHAIVVLTPQANDTTLQSLTTETDNFGYFKFEEELPVIRYTLVVEADTFEPQKMDIDLEPGVNEKIIELMPVRTCKDNSECDADDFCKKPIGVCENETGICSPRPFECIMIQSPVCGCNERTYGNECIASSFGINILYEGACRTDQE